MLLLLLKGATCDPSDIGGRDDGRKEPSGRDQGLNGGAVIGGGNARPGEGSQPDKKEVGWDDCDDGGGQIRPEPDGSEAVGVVGKPEWNRAKPEECDDAPALPAYGRVDEPEFWVCPDPAQERCTSAVAGDEEVGCGTESGAESNCDESTAPSKDEPAGGSQGANRRKNHLSAGEENRINEDAQPPQILEERLGGLYPTEHGCHHAPFSDRISQDCNRGAKLETAARLVQDVWMESVQIYNRQRRLSVNREWLQAAAAVALKFCQDESADGRFALRALPEVEVSLVSDRTIAKVHRDFLQIPGATDVITFEHGEILVSVETALANGAENGLRLEEELLLYTIHGMLHLNGFEDEAPADAARMHRVQERILRRCLKHLPLPS